MLEEAVARLRSLGAIVTDPVSLPDAEKIAEPEFAALRYEFKYGINAYLAYVADFSVAGALPGTLAELIDFNKPNADLVLSRFGQEVFEQAEATSGDLADPTTCRCGGTPPGSPVRPSPRRWPTMGSMPSWR